MSGQERLGISAAALALVVAAVVAAPGGSARGVERGNDAAQQVGTARLVSELRYLSPGVMVGLEAKRVYCDGQLVLQMRVDHAWQVVKSKPVSGCVGVGRVAIDVGRVYGLNVRSPRDPHERDRYRVVSTQTGQPRRVSQTLVIHSVGAKLTGHVTKRATGQGIDLNDEFPYMNVVAWLKTPHGWREHSGVGWVGHNGDYRIPDLKPGRYKVQVQIRREGTHLAEQWAGDVDSSDAARVVHLPAAAVQHHVDVSLPRGRDVWFGVAGRGPRCVGLTVYPPGEQLGYLSAGGPQPDAKVSEIPGLPLTSYKMKINNCSHSAMSLLRWPTTWYDGVRTRRTASTFSITSKTTSSRHHPRLVARMLHR